MATKEYFIYGALIPMQITIKVFYTLNNCASQESKCECVCPTSAWEAQRQLFSYIAI